MTRIKGGALAGWLLFSWVVTARATTTVTQQSSAAWGSVENGRPVERGTHTSHTSDVLPDGHDTDLSVRFGFGPPRQRPVPEPEPEPELGLRGGFGNEDRTSPQGDPSISQQPLPTSGSGQDNSQQPISDDALFNDAYNALLGQYPNYNINIGGQYPWQAFPPQQPGLQGGVYGPWTGPQWPQQPDLGVRGGFDTGRPQPAGSGVYNPWQQVPFVSGAGGAPVPATGPAPSQGTGPAPSQGTVPPSGGAGGPATQGAGAPVQQPAGQAVTNPGLYGTAGGVGLAYPSYTQPGYPQFQVPDINAYVNQMTMRALQNIARGMAPGVSPGAAAPGVSGVHVRHNFSSGSPPGQPGVQSQQASVNSVSFQHTPPRPSARPVYPNPAGGFPQLSDQSRHTQQQQTDTSAAWP